MENLRIQNRLRVVSVQRSTRRCCSVDDALKHCIQHIGMYSRDSFCALDNLCMLHSIIRMVLQVFSRYLSFCFLAYP